MELNRRQWLAAAAGVALAQPAKSAPTAPVSIARCDTYGPALEPVLAKMFDQIGGLGKIVAGKTVAIKVNLTGGAGTRLWHEPAELAHWTHPDVIAATVAAHGQGRRQADSASRELRLGCGSARGAHDSGRLGAERDAERRSEGGDGKYGFARLREEVPAGSRCRTAATCSKPSI